MAGTITKSLPVYIVENQAFGNRAHCRLVEDRQWFGDYSDEAIEGLRMWRDVWALSLANGITHVGGLSQKPITTKALQMGDELPNRPNAATSLFTGAVAVPMIEAGVSKDDLVSTLSYVTGHDRLFGDWLWPRRSLRRTRRQISNTRLWGRLCLGMGPSSESG